jgi:hypothetical protein
MCLTHGHVRMLFRWRVLIALFTSGRVGDDSRCESWVKNFVKRKGNLVQRKHAPKMAPKTSYASMYKYRRENGDLLNPSDSCYLHAEQLRQRRT